MRRSLLTTSSLPAARCLLPAGSRQPAIGNYPPRRGSVLILVVALLVLMALIGTAYISTARIDRHSARQHQTNTQIDLLVDGVVAMIEAEIVGGLFDGQDFRAAESDSYNHFTSAFTDLWLADRIPGLATPAAPFNPNNPNANPPIWRNISWPLVRNGGSFQFHPPDRTTPFGLTDQKLLPPPPPPDPALPIYAWRPISYPLNGVLHPGLELLIWDEATTFQPSGQFLAADASGDGIADAGLWKIPGGELDGMTYYAAVRVIDNAAAINANIAWEPGSVGDDTDFYFPTSINLFGLLAGNAIQQDQQIDLLMDYRTNFVMDYNPPRDDSGATLGFSFISEQDALWMQLGRRLRNPGLNTDGERYQALATAESIAMAERFTLVRPEIKRGADPALPPNQRSSPSRLERWLSESLVEVPGRAPMPAYALAERPFRPDQWGRWFAINFDYGHPSFDMPLRPLLVGRNPVSNLSAAKPMRPELLDYNEDLQTAPRASINTDDTDVLFRAFANAMREGTGTPFDRDIEEAVAANIWPIDDPYYRHRFDPETGEADNTTEPEDHPARMFRSAIRDPRPPSEDTARLQPLGQLLLRAGLAAVNAQAMRTPATATPSLRTMDISLAQDLALVDKSEEVVVVTVYGMLPQPFITEIYAINDNATEDRDDPTIFNENGYIAVELHNPYDEEIGLAGWKLIWVDRATYPGIELDDTQVIHEFVAGDTMPANGYRVLENYDPMATVPGAARFRPQSALPASGDDAGFASPIIVPNLHEAFERELVLMRPGVGTDLEDMVPVDQFDFTGFPRPLVPRPEEGTEVPITIWHYVRENASGEWRFVYPGRYDGSRTERRQQGTRLYGDPDDPGYVQAVGDSMELLPPTFDPPVAMGLPDALASYSPTFSIPLELNSGAVSTTEYPFGGFARDGDILRVPFIGAYRIRLAGTTPTVLEMNSITMDAAFAEDTDPTNDEAEQIGRFAPIHADDSPGSVVDDYAFDHLDAMDPNGRGGEYWDTNADPPLPQWRYRWAMNLLDYVTVQAPHDDYLPNAPEGSGLTRQEVSNSGRTANSDEELIEPIDGLVNINTASWRVLAALPLVLDSAGRIDPVPNENLAKAIVHFRDVDGRSDPADPVVPHGPFRSIFELNKVWDTLNENPADGFRNAMGTYTPPDSSFEARNAQLIRLSNLITTRSDSFTVYLVVQGWRDAGSANAELVAQRRRAFIIDRSRVTPTDNRPVKHNVPTN